MPVRATPAYTTVEEVMLVLDITEFDGEEETHIENLIEWASEYIDRRTRRWWSAETQTRHYDYQSSTKLRLDQELLAITTFTNGDGETISSADYFLYPLSGPPYSWIEIDSASSEAFTYSNSPQKAISIAGTWGATTTPPQRIVKACEKLVIAALNSFAESGLKSLTTEFASYTFDREEDSFLKSTLNNRRIVIG